MHASFSVDGTPIREFKNAESIGVPFPKDQAMRIYSSLRNADGRATRGELDNEWSQSPFTASFRNFNAQAYTWPPGSSSCASTSSSLSDNAWLSRELDSASQEKLRWVRKNYVIYNYCTDLKPFPQDLPLEYHLS